MMARPSVCVCVCVCRRRAGDRVLETRDIVSDKGSIEGLKKEKKKEMPSGMRSDRTRQKVNIYI